MRDRRRPSSSTGSVGPARPGLKTPLSARARATLSLQRAIGNQAVSGMILQLAQKEADKEAKPSTEYTLTMAPLGPIPVLQFHVDAPRRLTTRSGKAPPPPVVLTLAATKNSQELFKASVEGRMFEQAVISGAAGAVYTLTKVFIGSLSVVSGGDEPVFEVRLDAEKIEFGP